MADKIFPTGFSNLASVDSTTSLLGDDGSVNGLLTVAEVEAVVVTTDSMTPASGTLTVNGGIAVLQNSDTVSITHDGTDAYFKTTDGYFIFQSAEAAPASTYLDVRPNGSGQGILNLYDQNSTNYINITITGGNAIFETVGAGAGSIYFQQYANNGVNFYNSAGSGETPSVDISGRRGGDSKRTLNVGISAAANDTALFDGVSNYAFDGVVESKVGTATYATSQTLTAVECTGYVIYVTGAATITLPAVADGMSVTVITIGAVAVSVDPNASDKIWLDGTALDDGDKITNASTAGDVATLTYYSADGWYASTNGWSDGGA